MGVWGFRGLGVWGLGVWGFRGLGFRVQGFGLRVWLYVVAEIISAKKVYTFSSITASYSPKRF